MVPGIIQHSSERTPLESRPTRTQTTLEGRPDTRELGVQETAGAIYRHCEQVRDIDMEAILILYYQITYSYIYIYLLTEQ